MRLEEYIARGYTYGTARKRQAPIWATRGCPYCCEFCSAPTMNGRPLRLHSIEYLVEWVKYLYHQKRISCIGIIDDNFTFHVDFAKAFCEAMIRLNLKNLHFTSPNGIRVQRTDAELFKLMKRCGWEDIVIAPESGSSRTLKSMKKNIDLSIVPAKVAEIKRHGLIVRGNFMIGYPGETRDDLKKTQELLRKCRFNLVQISCFQPLPGTPVYDKLVANGEIMNGQMPDDNLSGKTQYIPAALRDFNFPRYILKNYLYVLFNNPTNIWYVYRLVRPRMLIKLALSLMRNLVPKLNFLKNVPNEGRPA
jgi:radical SAM superfamily enzyme YgiQ (UPF0313 family)